MNLGEIRQHRLVRVQPRAERVFHARRRARAHLASGVVEPRVEERLARRVTAPEERGYGCLWQRRAVRCWQRERGERERVPGEAVGLDEREGCFQELRSM